MKTRPIDVLKRPGWHYTPAAATDIRKTFARARERQKPAPAPVRLVSRGKA
jgi:hypothetical protein